MPPQVYRRLVNTVDPNHPFDPTHRGTLEQPHEETIGLNIMIRAGSITLPAGMKELMNVFYEVMEKRFKWDPRSPGNNAAVGAAVLDGERKFGECGCLANALLCLLRCPRPYGFGLNESSRAAVIPYNGDFRNERNECLGFIARHDDTFYKLGPNVLNPKNVSERRYYLWDNHKVLNYNWKYWDVCYNRQYDDPEEMATGMIMQETHKREYMLYNVWTGQRTVYYVNNNRQLDAGWAHVIGPYDQDPGPPEKGTNVGPSKVRKSGNSCVIC